MYTYFDESRSLRMLGEGCMKGSLKHAYMPLVVLYRLVNSSRRTIPSQSNLSNRRVSASHPVHLADLASLPVD